MKLIKKIFLQDILELLTPEKWFKLAKQLESKKIKFHIKPHTRFKNKAGEQHTMFIKDPDNNFLEFKAFEDDENIFKNCS